MGSKKERLGLLCGIDPQTAEHFSSNLAMKHYSWTGDGLAWLQKPGVFWRAVKRDAKLLNLSAEEYLSNINTSFQAFCTSGWITGHEFVQRCLDQRCSWKGGGDCILLTGGPKTGKTVLLKNLRERFNFGEKKHAGCIVLYVDCRRYQQALNVTLFMDLARLQIDFLAGDHMCLMEGWRDRLVPYYQQIFFSRGCSNDPCWSGPQDFIRRERLTKEARTALLVQLKKLSSAVFGGGSNKNNCTTSFELPSTGAIIQCFSNFAKAQKRFPILIIDETDEELRVGGLYADEWVPKLQQMTNKREMNMIISSSDQNYDCLLDSLGYDLMNDTTYLVAGDISPREAWNFLVNTKQFTGTTTNHPAVEIVEIKIGMGKNLAKLCLAAYGGHLLTIKDAMMSLSKMKQEFRATHVLDLLPFAQNVTTCLEYIGAQPLLRAMAQHGFVSVRNFEDVNVVVDCNLGSLIHPGMDNHIPPTMWERAKYSCDGLSPCNGVERIAIALELANRKESMIQRLRSCLRKLITKHEIEY